MHCCSCYLYHSKGFFTHFFCCVIYDYCLLIFAVETGKLILNRTYKYIKLRLQLLFQS